MKNLLLRARLLVLLAGLLLAAPALWSCNTETAPVKALREHEEKMVRIDEDTIRNNLTRNNLLSTATRTSSGLYLVTLATGTGTPITNGRQVRVRYIGRFLSNGAQPGSTGYPASPGDPRYPQGAIFDNSSDKGVACGCAVFTAGSTTKGFDEGLLLMRQGDRKLLLVPSRLAYGPGGSAGSIPPDSALMFDVEILEVL